MVGCGSGVHWGIVSGARGPSACHGEFAERALHARNGSLLADGQKITCQGADVFLEEGTLWGGVHWVVLWGWEEGMERRERGVK